MYTTGGYYLNAGLHKPECQANRLLGVWFFFFFFFGYTSDNFTKPMTAEMIPMAFPALHSIANPLMPLQSCKFER
jgi:hypothetical protein